ncbi:hypothetical protein AVEN_68307-1 [Araneus ventricosus]|uniref:Uncharacterized protein n=1 Tax=Araneus ventricosus TaxID=182803 RepID=A0A4Y2UB37_ARAVE|nr:hypothetical protein AVEN_68307-1 [Araneus ventricosus]
MVLNHLIPQTIGKVGPQNTGTPEFLFHSYGKFTSPLKNRNDSWHCPNSKETTLFPNPSRRATLKEKARSVGVKSVTLNEREKFPRDIRTLRTAAVFSLKSHWERSRID